MNLIFAKKKYIYFVDSTNQFIKMSYCQFNRQEILQTEKERYSKEKLLSITKKNQRTNARKVK